MGLQGYGVKLIMERLGDLGRTSMIRRMQDEATMSDVEKESMEKG